MPNRPIHLSPLVLRLDLGLKEKPANFLVQSQRVIQLVEARQTQITAAQIRNVGLPLIAGLASMYIVITHDVDRGATIDVGEVGIAYRPASRAEPEESNGYRIRISDAYGEKESQN